MGRAWNDAAAAHTSNYRRFTVQKNRIISAVCIVAMAGAAASVAQQGTQPERRQPTQPSQPSTQPDRTNQPGRSIDPARPGVQDRQMPGHDMRNRSTGMNDQAGHTVRHARELARGEQEKVQMIEQNTKRLRDQLTQANSQSGDERIETLTNILQTMLDEREAMVRHGKEHTALVIAHELAQAGQQSQFETLRSEFPFLRDAKNVNLGTDLDPFRDTNRDLNRDRDMKRDGMDKKPADHWNDQPNQPKRDDDNPDSTRPRDPKDPK